MEERYRFVNILISNLKVEDDRIFTYKIDKEKYDTIKVGMRAIVPFGKGNRNEEGYIIEVDKEINIEEEKIKEIISIPDRFTYFDDEMLNLAKYISKKCCATLAECINTFVPQSVRFLKRKEKIEKFVKLSGEYSSKENEPKLKELINKLSNNKTKLMQAEILKIIVDCVQNQESDFKLDNKVMLKTLLEELNISKSPIDTLIKNGVIDIFEEYANEDEEIKSKDKNIIKKITDITLTDKQREVYEQIKHSSSDEFLLKGVTGSGKTEVFIKLAEHYIKEGKNVVILVPEIGLTPQMVRRFEENFENISIMHSKLSASEKLEEWKKVKENKVNIVIGPRSAIFMPISNIGLIIVDEEHEMTYKSELTPKYKTKDVARFRAKYNNAKLIFASATPSLETYMDAITGKIELAVLNERFNKKEMPKIQVVDMKEELEKGNKSIFSVPLANAIKERLERKEQILLFLNRRGFSTFVSCRKCGHVMKCEHCNVPYVYHQKNDSLECHYCFERIPNVHVCPECGSKYIKHFGIGTERVEEEIKKIFPAARILRMDADTTSRKNSSEEILGAFKEEKADILIGTQMIAKGHNFPNVTLVGIIAADVMLNFQDFRASERTFQLITQVAGRSGRNEKEGIVIMQTYDSEHYAIEAAANYNYEGFMKSEIFLRKQMNCPPFTYLFYTIFVCNDENLVIGEIKKLAEYYKSIFEDSEIEVEILGPGPAAISKHKDMYRWQIILRGNDEEYIRENAMSCIAKYKKASNASKNILIQLNFD